MAYYPKPQTYRPKLGSASPYRNSAPAPPLLKRGRSSGRTGDEPDFACHVDRSLGRMCELRGGAARPYFAGSSLILSPLSHGDDLDWCRYICRTEDCFIGLMIGGILIDTSERILGCIRKYHHDMRPT